MWSRGHTGAPCNAFYLSTFTSQLSVATSAAIGLKLILDKATSFIFEKGAPGWISPKKLVLQGVKAPQTPQSWVGWTAVCSLPRKAAPEDEDRDGDNRASQEPGLVLL